MRLMRYCATTTALLLAGCGMVERVGPPPGSQNSMFRDSIYYAGTSGKVGVHMSAGPHASCSGSWDYDRLEHASGALPPGMHMSGSRIEGTPEQPGVWSVAITFYAPRCNGVVYANKLVHVRFNIKGIPVRRIQ